MRVLVVEDAKDLNRLIVKVLMKAGYSVDGCFNGEEAKEHLMGAEYDAMLLDVMMPKMDGWQVCREIRSYSKVPIIMLTARGDERDELQGFELGVDEYITKPFSPRILVARVEAILRRTSGNTENEEILEAGGIRVDKTAHMVEIHRRNVVFGFTSVELLAYFVDNTGLPLSRDKILYIV